MNNKKKMYFIEKRIKVEKINNGKKGYKVFSFNVVYTYLYNKKSIKMTVVQLIVMIHFGELSMGGSGGWCTRILRIKKVYKIHQPSG